MTGKSGVGHRIEQIFWTKGEGGVGEEMGCVSYDLGDI